eukprot:COSAG01_NODE_6472_length_3645_cov_2.862662_1_plen_347_part_00
MAASKAQPGTAALLLLLLMTVAGAASALALGGALYSLCSRPPRAGGVPSRRAGLAAPLRDVELLLTTARFLAQRTGVDVAADDPRDDEPVLAAIAEAYGERGNSAVRRLLEAHRGDWPREVLSICACEASSTVQVNYPGGETETLRFEAAPRGRGAQLTRVEGRCNDGSPCSLRPERASRASRGRWVAGRGLVFTPDVCLADSTQADAKAKPPPPRPPPKATGPAGVECLWWAVRFLHADLTRDYGRQRRYLAHDAAAFGAQGREAVLDANGERSPDDKKTAYAVPYPLSVDGHNGTVVLMFDAFSSGGQQLYRGTDIMIVKSGLVHRITTINHTTGACWSPQTAE